EPLSTCTYNLLYQDLKRFSKNGEYFCKELVTVFQQRSELEISYAKRLQKLAGKLLSVSKTMTSNSTYNAWSLVSNEMFSSADAHSLQQDAVVEIRQMLDEQTKRKRPAKKKLTALTREHEALFSFVEKNKHICTEKEKQKIVQETEKQRIESLSNTVNKYNLHMGLLQPDTTSSLTRRGMHSTRSLKSQEQIEEAVRRVDVEKDIQTLVENTCITADDNKAEFLIVDYFVRSFALNMHISPVQNIEEEGKTVMEKERRRDALKAKLQRVKECILKTRKEKEGLEKMLGLDTENISHSTKTLEEQEQLLEEYVLKLDLLEATYCKLNQSMMDLEGKPKPFHRFNDGLTKFKEKEFEHSIVKLPRPVRIKSTAFRARHSFRSSVIFKGPVKNAVDCQDSVPSVEASSRSAKYTHKHKSEINRASSRSQEETRECAEFSSVGKCKALYDFSSEKKDELNIKEGDLLDILRKDNSGWWYGELNGKRGHFPYNYVEELPVLKMAKSSDA
ncbi:hypothetical protein QTP70_023919, partial [Hemibagrus guttatus]